MIAPHSDGLQAFTVTLLRCQGEYLLLQRSPVKRLAPMRWTGLGGHVEADEYHTLRKSSLREVQEEAGIQPDEITNYVLRRVLLVSRPRQTFSILFYYTGDLPAQVIPTCPEGTLHWKPESEFSGLDIIETTRPVLSLLVHDMREDPSGLELPQIGMALFNSQEEYERVIWGS